MSADSAENRNLPLRGFARLDPARLAEISAQGGRAAHEAGTAHKFTSDEGKRAGRRGGLESHKRKREAAEREDAGT